MPGTFISVAAGDQALAHFNNFSDVRGRFRLHIRQATTAAAFDLIRAAKRRGVRVTCGITPAHLHLSDIAMSDFRTYAHVSPPLRSESGTTWFSPAGQIVLVPRHTLPAPELEERASLPDAQELHDVEAELIRTPDEHDDPPAEPPF